MKRKSTLIVAISELLLAILMTTVIFTSEKKWTFLPFFATFTLNLAVYFVSSLYFHSWWKTRLRKSKMVIKKFGTTTALMYEKEFIILD